MPLNAFTIRRPLNASEDVTFMARTSGVVQRLRSKSQVGQQYIMYLGSSTSGSPCLCCFYCQWVISGILIKKTNKKKKTLSKLANIYFMKMCDIFSFCYTFYYFTAKWPIFVISHSKRNKTRTACVKIATVHRAVSSLNPIRCFSLIM